MRQGIRRALEAANVGVVLISKSFIGKLWPMRELREFVQQYGKALPVLYLMSYAEYETQAALQAEVGS